MRELVVAMEGAGIYGNIALGKAGDFDYELVFGTVDVDANEGFIKEFLASLTPPGVVATDTSFSVEYFGGASLIYNTPFGLRLGGVILGSDAEVGATVDGQRMLVPMRTKMLSTASVEYVWNDLTLAAEYYFTKIDVEVPGAPSIEVENEGYYGLAAYRFTDWFSLGLSYGEYYPDKNDKDGNAFVARGMPDFLAWQKDLALSAAFFINDNWTVKLEAHKMEGAAQLAQSLQAEELEEDWYLYLVKASYNF